MVNSFLNQQWLGLFAFENLVNSVYRSCGLSGFFYFGGIMTAFKETKQAQILSKLATSDLVKGEIVIQDSAKDNAVKKAADASVMYAGVVEDAAAKTGDLVDVMSSNGVARVLVGGAITAGDTIIADADGKAIAGTAGYILGQAEESVAAPEADAVSYVSVRLSIHKA